MSRFPIYARLSIPEIWCYNSGKLTIYKLQNEEYIEVENSSIFPSLPLRELPQIIEKYRRYGKLALRRSIRNWTINNQL